MIRTAIIGGSGYVGGELLRLLLAHPGAEVVVVASRTHTGVPVSRIHPNLHDITDLVFVEPSLELIKAKAEVIFFALPHGQAMAEVRSVRNSGVRVIDLSADFRLKDHRVFAEVYKMRHEAPGLLSEAVYGLPEYNADKLVSSWLVACPGCYPTGALLALLPLLQEKLVTGSIIVDSKTGSSGSGAEPSLSAHHPERAHDFRAYNVLSHRHQPEIRQEAEILLSGEIEIVFAPHSASMVRGIFTTAYGFLRKPLSTENLQELYRQIYTGKPFVRLVANPRCAVVAHANYCDLTVFTDGSHVVATSAIDNLIKGGAGQAIQCMNLMFGLSETTGLEFSGTHP